LDESSVFAESGVSGGSVGLAVHRAMGSNPFASALSEDFASPDIAAMVFRDPEAFWIPTPVGAGGHAEPRCSKSRGNGPPAVRSRRGCSRSHGRHQTRCGFPFMVFNSATVDDGCRLDVSVLQAATVGLQLTSPAGPVTFH
jgi:hypothetical protein